MKIVLVGLDEYYGFGHRFILGAPVDVDEEIASALLSRMDGEGRQVFCGVVELGPAEVSLKLKDPSESFFNGNLHLSGAMVASVPKKLADFYLRKTKGGKRMFEVVEKNLEAWQ